MRSLHIVVLLTIFTWVSPYRHAGKAEWFGKVTQFLDSIPEKCQPREASIPPECLQHITEGTADVITPAFEGGRIRSFLSFIPLVDADKALELANKLKNCVQSKLTTFGLDAFPSVKTKFTLGTFMANLVKRGLHDTATRPTTDSQWTHWKSFPTTIACNELPPREFIPLSIKDVCPTLSRCSGSVHSSEKNACTDDDKCDVTKAIPLMVELFFYKLGFTMVDELCGRVRCPEGCYSGCEIVDQVKSIPMQVKWMNAFVNMMPENRPFEAFYRDAVRRRAYSRIDEAMRIISENENTFSDARFACDEIEAEAACQFLTIRPHYLLLKKMREQRLQPGHLGFTRDLTLHENVDHAKLIGLKQDTIKHAELLSAINQLDSNLQVHIQGISSYFKGISQYEKGIANADKDFINGKLTSFETEFTRLQEKVRTDLNDTMIAMETLLGIELAEETVALGTKIAAETNPLKAIFSGEDEKGVRDQTKIVADLAADLVHGGALIAKLIEVKNDTMEIALCLQDNKEQITNLIEVVDSIKDSHSENVGYNAEGFVEQYAAYTPKVDRHRMEQNIAMWGALKDSACDLLNDVGGILAAAGKAIANGFLLCENLEGTIAEFNALRENIFDFQFELVDILARIVRSNLANKLAASIGKQQNDLFKAHELLGGFLMSQIFIQSQAWLYCDKIEYLNEGERVQVCLPDTGLFTNNDLDKLVAFTDHKTYISIERTVFIPSKPQSDEDTGFINIQKLAEEKTASFKLPRDIKWLYKFHWSLMGEPHAPYVENFQLFLPNKEHDKTGAAKVQTSTRIVVSADPNAGSYISTDEAKSVRYLLPEKQTSYVTVYQEGYRKSTCSREIPNPYSLCNNLPKICHTSSKVAGDSLLPTTLSRWKITYTVQSGENEAEWLAPNSATDLYFIAKLTLRMTPRKSPKNLRSVNPVDEQDVCCQDNTYRSSLVTSECVECPAESTSRLGGCYCEVNPSAKTGEKRGHKHKKREQRKQKKSRERDQAEHL